MQNTSQKAWALIPRAPGARLHVVAVDVLDVWQGIAGAYVQERANKLRLHFVPFSRLASTLPRLREVVRKNLGRSEKSASQNQAGDQSTQAAA